MPKFAANLSMLFPETPFLDRFAAAAAAGFRGVEFLFPYEHPADQLASRLRQHDLEQVLFNLPPGDWGAGERGFAALPGREEEFAASVEQALAYAEMLGVPRLHVMAGIVPPDLPRERCEETYIANLEHAASRLAARGIVALIEPINARDMPGYFLRTTAEARRVIERVGAPNLRLQLDLYHAQVSEGDLVERIRTNRDITAHVQIAGNPGRHEPDIGEIHYPYLFDLLDELGYDGWIGCEYRPRGDTVAGLAWGRRYGLGRAADAAGGAPPV
jgi:2-dehydrotetronate isomerase